MTESFFLEPCFEFGGPELGWAGLRWAGLLGWAGLGWLGWAGLAGLGGRAGLGCAAGWGGAGGGLGWGGWGGLAAGCGWAADGQQQQAISIYFFLEGLGFRVWHLGHFGLRMSSQARA